MFRDLVLRTFQDPAVATSMGREHTRSPSRGISPARRDQSNAMVESLTEALSSILPQLAGNLSGSPMDLVQLGMGLGMSLQGLVPTESGGADSGVAAPSRHGQAPAGARGIAFGGPELQGPPPVAPGAQPIGTVDATQSNRTARMLDHRAEADQRENIAQNDAALTTAEQSKGMAIVTDTPDEEPEGHIMHSSRENEAKRQVPVFAYPPELLGKDYSTHEIAGSGVSFIPEGNGDEQNFVAESKVSLPFSMYHFSHFLEMIAFFFLFFF